MVVVVAITIPAHAAVVCQKKSGAMFVREACKKKETPVDLSQFGAVGPTGPAGQDGADATALWAVVDADGTLARGSGVVSSARLEPMFLMGIGPAAVGDGSYEVIFDRDVTSCAYIATLGQATLSGEPLRGGISVVPRFQNAAGVFVQTSNVAGADANGGFHLAVFCP